MLRAGRLDREIQIERKTVTRDAIGGEVESWQVHAGIWAEVIPVRGSEALRFSREVSTELSRFRIHYIDEITTGDRIRYQGNDWNIIYSQELGRRQGLELTAERIA